MKRTIAVSLGLLAAGSSLAAVSLDAARNACTKAMREVYDLELTPPKVNVTPGPDFARTNMVFAINGGMAMTSKGRLWSIWHAGEDGPKAHVVGTWSDDGGRTWHDTRIALCSPRPLFKCTSGIDWTGNVLNVNLSCLIANIWFAPDGTLRLYANIAVNGFNGRGVLYEYICANPDAERPTWSEGRQIGWGGAHNKPQVLSDGTWIIPNDFEAILKRNFPELDPLRGCGVLASRDRGKSWTRRGFVRPEGTEHYAEHQLVELADCSLLMYLRTGFGLMESRSTDGGWTWTKPVAPKSVRQIISRFAFHRLANGHLLFVKNGDTPMSDKKGEWWSRRCQLTAFVSDDEGETWQGGLSLDARDIVAYPDLFVAPDGFIYVSYDHDRITGNAEILYAKFTEADVRAGRLVTPESSLRNVVFSAKR